VDVVRAIRSAIGQDMAVMVDYNQSLTAAEAVERLRVLDDLGLTWIEEPTLAHDYDGHAIVANAIRTPIQSGENWWGPLDVRHAIQAQASDFVMLEVMKLGGVTGWKRAAAMAETHNLRISTHLWTELSTQLLSTTPLRHWLEYCDWWNPILAEPLQTQDGYASPSTAPGSGVTWNEAAVEKYLA
jgi:mandelate racemase